MFKPQGISDFADRQISDTELFLGFVDEFIVNMLLGVCLVSGFSLLPFFYR